MTKATIAWPVVASVAPTTAASATDGCETSADSTSVVEMLWPGHEHHVVDPAEQPDVAVVVLLRAVAGEVLALEARPVRVEEPLVVAPDGAQHRRPRLGEHQVAAAAVRAPRCASSSTTSAEMPGSGRLRRARLGRGHAGQRGDHDGAGLGLPPGVHDRGQRSPPMCLRYHIHASGLIGSPTRAEHPQRRQVELGGDVVAPLHERADRGRRGVEDRDPVLLRRSPRTGPGAGCPACPRT